MSQTPMGSVPPAETLRDRAIRAVAAAFGLGAFAVAAIGGMASGASGLRTILVATGAMLACNAMGELLARVASHAIDESIEKAKAESAVSELEDDTEGVEPVLETNAAPDADDARTRRVIGAGDEGGRTGLENEPMKAAA